MVKSKRFEDSVFIRQCGLFEYHKLRLLLGMPKVFNTELCQTGNYY